MMEILDEQAWPQPYVGVRVRWCDHRGLHFGKVREIDTEHGGHLVIAEEGGPGRLVLDARNASLRVVGPPRPHTNGA